MNIKRFDSVSIKADADTGEVEAVFSRFNVVDLDGDVTLPGAFTEGAPVRISAYGHASWGSALPVGKGTIHSTPAEAILRGTFFMQTSHGRDTFEVIKQMGDLQEWSYGYDVDDGSPGTFEGREVRFLRKLTVHEVSPVLLGAGIGTRTLATKGSKQLVGDLRTQLAAAARERFGDEDTWVWVRDFDLDEAYAIVEVETDQDIALHRIAFERDDDRITLADDSTEVMPVTTYTPKQRQKRFTEHAATVLADVAGLTERATGVLALRASKGKTLSPASVDLLGSIGSELKRLEQLLAGDGQDDEIRDAAAREFARYVALRQGVA